MSMIEQIGEREYQMTGPDGGVRTFTAPLYRMAEMREGQPLHLISEEAFAAMVEELTALRAEVTTLHDDLTAEMDTPRARVGGDA